MSHKQNFLFSKLFISLFFPVLSLFSLRTNTPKMCTLDFLALCFCLSMWTFFFLHSFYCQSTVLPPNYTGFVGNLFPPCGKPIEYYYLWTYDVKKRFNKIEADVLFRIVALLLTNVAFLWSRIRATLRIATKKRSVNFHFFSIFKKYFHFNSSRCPILNQSRSISCAKDVFSL